MAAELPYTVHLDPDSARNLATHGASILLLGVPLGTPIGLDQQVSTPQLRIVNCTSYTVHVVLLSAQQPCVPEPTSASSH